MSEEVRHIQVNGKYRVCFERSGVKGIDGFKVEANDDDIDIVLAKAEYLYIQAKHITIPELNKE